MRRDNRGLSLMELVVAMAIGSIVALAAILFVGQAMRSYTRASSTIDLQKESQVLMEQMSTWIMEGNRVELMDDAAVGKVLIIYRIPKNMNSDKVPSAYRTDKKADKKVIWQQNGRLYMAEQTDIADVDADTTTISAPMAVDANCVSEYMKGFSVEIDKVDKTKVTISIHMREKDQEHKLKDTITVRNIIQ